MCACSQRRHAMAGLVTLTPRAAPAAAAQQIPHQLRGLPGDGTAPGGHPWLSRARSVLAMPHVHEGRRQRRRGQPPPVVGGACISGTIATHVALPFVAVAVAGRIRTGHIEQNPTPGALHGQMRLGRGLWPRWSGDTWATPHAALRCRPCGGLGGWASGQRDTAHPSEPVAWTCRAGASGGVARRRAA